MKDRAAAHATLLTEMAHLGGNTGDPGWKITMIELAEPGAGTGQLKEELEKASLGEYVKGNDFAYAFEIALAWNNLGDKEKALHWLERAEAAGAHNFNFLEVDPRLANLRGEPRFATLLKTLK